MGELSILAIPRRDARATGVHWAEASRLWDDDLFSHAGANPERVIDAGRFA